MENRNWGRMWKSKEATKREMRLVREEESMLGVSVREGMERMDWVKTERRERDRETPRREYGGEEWEESEEA